MEIDIKNKEKTGKLVTILLAGVLLLIIAIPSKKSQSVENSSEEVSYNYVNNADYYEEKLKAILESSYGEGSMEVMVHLACGEQENSFYSSDSTQDMVDGVLVVAEVADEQAVSDITFAVCALFDLPAHKVAVLIKK